MALLIVDLHDRIGNAKAWRGTFAEQLPDLEVRFWPDAGELADIEYLAFMHPDFDALPSFPHARASSASRHAGLSGGAGKARVAPDEDHPPRGKADRLPRLRPDGEGAGAGAEIARLSGFGLGSQLAGGSRNSDLPRRGPARAVSEPDRHRGLPVAADAGNRRHLLRPHLCNDAAGRDARKCRARQTCRGEGPDRGARFGAVILRRIGCA